MEIFEFLNLSARRLVALAMLTVLVAIPTAGLLLRGPVQYRATATVRLTAFLPPGTSPGVLAEIEDGFGAALALPQVGRDTAAATGVSAARLHNRVTVDFPNGGSTAEVSYTDTAQRAPQVVRVAAVTALTFAVQQEVDQTAAVLAEANRRVDQAITAFTAFEALTKVGAADIRMRTLTLELLDLQHRRAEGEGASAAAINETSADLAKVTAIEPQYRQVVDAFNQALTGAQGATRDHAAATTALASASSGTTIAVKQVVPVGRLKQGLIYGFGAGLAAALVAVAVLAVEEFRRRPTPRHVHQRAGLTVLADRALDALPPDAVAKTGQLLLVPAGLIVGSGVLFLMSQHRATLALALALAAPLGLAAGTLAITRFELFLGSMLVVRASLDSFNIAGQGGGGLDPGVVIGAVFIVASLLWLAAQRRAGRWVPASRVTHALWLFAAACVVSIPASILRSASIIGSSKVIAGVLMFSVLEQYLGQRPDRARVVVGCLFLSLPVPAAVGLHQWLTNRGNLGTAGVSRVTGTFVHPSTLGVYLLLLLPLAVVLIGYYRGRVQKLLMVAAGVAALLLVVTYTRDAWLAGIVCLAYLGIRVRRQLLYVMGATIVVLLIAVPSVAGRFADLHAKPLAPGAPPPTNSLSWRIGYWERLIPLGNSSPVTGIGFETVERTTPERLAPHNAVVEAYVETGVVGLVAFLWLMWTFADYLRRRLRYATPGWERLLALGAMSAALGLVVQLPGENLLTQTFIYWYAAAAMTFGLRPSGPTDPAPAPEEVTASPDLPEGIDEGSIHLASIDT